MAMVVVVVFGVAGCFESSLHQRVLLSLSFSPRMCVCVPLSLLRLASNMFNFPPSAAYAQTKHSEEGAAMRYLRRTYTSRGTGRHHPRSFFLLSPSLCQGVWDVYVCVCVCEECFHTCKPSPLRSLFLLLCAVAFTSHSGNAEAVCSTSSKVLCTHTVRSPTCGCASGALRCRSDWQCRPAR